MICPCLFKKKILDDNEYLQNTKNLGMFTTDSQTPWPAEDRPQKRGLLHGSWATSVSSNVSWMDRISWYFMSPVRKVSPAHWSACWTRKQDRKPLHISIILHFHMTTLHPILAWYSRSVRNIQVLHSRYCPPVEPPPASPTQCDK